MTDDFSSRPETESRLEREFLERRHAEAERAMGQLAARLGAPTPVTRPMEALERARGLIGDLQKEVRVRTLDDAIASRLEWLERVRSRAAGGDDAAPALELLDLDARLLADLQRAWRARQK